MLMMCWNFILESVNNNLLLAVLGFTINLILVLWLIIITLFPPVLKFQKLSKYAIIPERKSKGAAGYDLYSPYDAIVPAHGKAKLPTDLALCLPAGVYARVAPKSGLAWDHSIDVGAGVIDFGKTPENPPTTGVTVPGTNSNHQVFLSW